VADLELWYPDRARAVYLEVTDLQTVRAAVEAAVKAFGCIKEVAGFGIKVTIIESGAFYTDFGTGSLAQADPLPGYESVRGAVFQAFADAVFGDPVRAALAMIQSVEAEEPQSNH
jgi:NAD(P)-dependent dehydrogenase (short-subunit alcohol dehydrogenase family)